MQLWGMGRELHPGLMAGKVEVEKSKWDDSEDVQFGKRCSVIKSLNNKLNVYFQKKGFRHWGDFPFKSSIINIIKPIK